MKSPEIRAGVVGLAVVGAIILGKSAVDAYSIPDGALNNAEAVAERVENELKTGQEIDVAAAIIQVDAGVNFRSSPVVINTNNTALITGNTINEIPEEGIIDGSLSGPTILVRPMVVKNEDRLSDEDPEYWLAGLQDDKLVWVGVNDETKQYMQAYQLPEADGEMTDFIDTVTVDYVNSREGVVFQSSGYAASSGLIREAPLGTQDPYLLEMESAGYQKVDLPLD